MKLSERGAIKSAIADGGFHLYPAGNLLKIISQNLGGDNLEGDFDVSTTPEKLSRIEGPSDPDANELFKKDLAILTGRLSVMEANYDIEAVFDHMSGSLKNLAKRYYGIEDIEFPRPQIVEYYFEGYSDIYKDADWSAFNVNSMESKELGIPVGIYFKRSQVAPGYPELVTMHESNHVMQEHTAMPVGYHSYLPWMDEGFADCLGKMMLFRATEDEKLLGKIKTFRTELEVTDQRRVTYHYGEETAILTLLRARLPFARTLMAVRRREPFSLDWNVYANLIRDGLDPHVAIIKAYKGNKLETFKKKIENDEKQFRSEGDLDQMDLRILSQAIATQPPATLEASEYKAALWLVDEVEKNNVAHFVDPEIIPEKLRGKIKDWTCDVAIAGSKLPAEIWEKVPEAKIKTIIHESAVPEKLKSGVDKLSTMYFVIKRKIGSDLYYEPYGGGLPYRLGTGEIRCSY
jgi:hypothetical protein